jgi:Trypsin-like peptidase domain
MRLAAFFTIIFPITAQTTAERVEKVYPSVALILAARGTGEITSAVGTGIVVNRNGVLLTAYHVIKDAAAVQVRFKDGEIFDDVQLLGVDTRRDVAALKIGGGGLSALPVAAANEAKAGDSVTVIGNAGALSWSVSTGVISAYRMADEVPGAGSGYRLFQFTAPVSPGSSGGVLLDDRGRALGLIVASLVGGQNLNFAVPVENVVGLGDAPPVRTFGSGASLRMPGEPARLQSERPVVTPGAPERSDALSPTKDREQILRTFKTMFIDANLAQYFRSEQMKAALGRNSNFGKLNITLVDDMKVADTILTVSYTPAWDYPFSLKYQNSSVVVVSGKGVGPFSGPAGAASVASELVKALMPYRIEPKSK